jgi:hypothetical protein
MTLSITGRIMHLKDDHSADAQNNGLSVGWRVLYTPLMA